MFFCTGSSLQVKKKKKESAHSRVDFSRVEALHGIAVSH